MDIEVVMKKTLIFAGIFASVYVIFAFFAFFGQMLFEKFVTSNRWIAMIPSVVVVTIMLKPMENFLINITDRFLFQKKYDYKKLLKIFTSEVLTVLELDKLIKLTEDRLSGIMKLRSCEVTLGAVRSDAELKIPITLHNKAMGTLLLGRKKSDEDYTQDDLDILYPLTKALGIAISNAKLFEELAKTQAEMAQKDKMATIGTLAAGMAHEIRNPITTIRNFADYLPERYDDRDFMDKFDKLIPREIDRIESIARSLLEFSSTEDIVKDEEFSIDDPIKTVISLLEPQYRTSEIRIVCDFSKKHIVKGSKIRLQDVIFNIMNYVMAETPKGGSIVIRCATGEKELKLYIRSEDLVVADYIIKDVFEPVSGLHREKRGFGFNIFVAKQLIEKGGGMLTILSDRSTGSEFCIRI
ncbi:MAG: histidine kinase dimerization/phospho-acceptor domain-containing protein [Candidatus Omnitrophota bacterium]|nr:histidine kinase dimerization/phospho-acceptor domain-containing protein [Candidatus Omnitrophota bacterium]